MIEVEHLKTLRSAVRIANCGSLAAAARRCRIGIALLIRLDGDLELTPRLHYFDWCAQISRPASLFHAGEFAAPATNLSPRN